MPNNNITSPASDDQGLITAVSADGVQHQFPAGTSLDVINRTMKTYSAKYTGHLADPSDQTSDPTWSGDVQGGLHDLGTSIAQGLDTAGGLLARHGAPQWGADLSSAGNDVQNNWTPAGPAGPSDGQQLGSALRNGNWSSVPSLALHAGLRAAVGSVPVLAAGAIDPALAAGVEALQAFGPNAYARAANNNRAAPNDDDVIGSLPADAGAAAAGYLLPGKGGSGVVGRAAYRVGSDLASGAVGSASSQLGDTVGTNRGASVDPSQVAADALTGATMGAARSAPEVVGSGVQGATDRAMAATLTPPATQAEAESILRVNAAMDARQQNATNTTGSKLPDTVVANSIKSDLQSSASKFIADARANGADSSDVAALRTLVNGQALRHNNTTSEDMGSLLGGLDTMNLPMPADRIAQFRRDAMDLNTVSSQSFINKTLGPAQRLGQLVGRYGGTAYELAHGSPMAALAAMGVGHSPVGAAGAKIVGAIGAGVDRALGTNTPTVRLQRLNAARFLQSQGINAADATDPTLFGSTTEVTGLPTDAVPVNTPIKVAASQQPASPVTAPAGTTAPLSALVPNTASDVRMAMSDDDKAPAVGTPQAAPQSPLQALTAQPTATAAAFRGAAQASPTGPAAGRFTPGSRYVANRVPGATHQDVVATAAELERLGQAPPGTAAMIDTSPAHVDPRIGAAIQQAMLERLLASGAAPTKGADQSSVMVDAQGNPIRSLPAYNAKVPAYQGHVAALADRARSTGIPGLDAVVLGIGATHGRDAAETVPMKRAAARAALNRLTRTQQELAAPYLLNDGLIQHG